MDSVVLALGARPINHLYGQVKGKVGEVYLIGDAVKPRKIMEATGEGAEVARQI
jgi:hypothetical protein